jgi:transcription initiation factor TFIID subunit 11
VFVVEIVEKGTPSDLRTLSCAFSFILYLARQVQSWRNDSGPLTPVHLREAYQMYRAETGRVGSARPMRGKRLFVR